MAPKNPVGKLAETALSTLKDPKAAAGRVVDQAKGTVALGKMVADTAGSVVSRAGRKGKKVPSTPATPAPEARETPPSPGLHAVPDTQPAASTGTAAKRVAEPSVKKATAASADSPKKQGDPVAPTKKAPAKKTPAKTATAEKTAVKKAPAKKAPAKKAPAKKAPAKKAPAKKVTATPADVAEVVEAAVAEDPKKTAARPARKPAKKSTTAKSPAKKTAAQKSSPGGKLPPRKASPGATGTNPSTGKPSTTQADEGSVVDPAAAKQVASDAATLRKAAESDPS